MRILEPSFKIEQCPTYEEALRVVELAARTCYKSEDNIDDGKETCPVCEGGTKRTLSQCTNCHCEGRVRVRDPSSVKLIKKILRVNRRDLLIERAKQIIDKNKKFVDEGDHKIHKLCDDLGTHGVASDIVDLVLHDVRENPSHESVLEHVVVSVRFTFDRGVCQELTRHRLGAYSGESTRYCDYGKKGVGIIDVPFWKDDEDVVLQISSGPEGSEKKYDVWHDVMETCSKGYEKLLSLGATPQEARDVLPMSLKTEIFTTFNLREWRHVLSLRTTRACHPQMIQIMKPLLVEMKKRLPVFFDDI